MDVAVLHLHAVDQAKLDEVESQLRVDHVRSSPVQRDAARTRADYLGCIRMPASMRIDSALMYELDSSSSARVANSVE